MAKYDDASWHYGGDYPKNLPIENGATHIGMFLTWCIDNNLVSEELFEDAEEEIQQVKDRITTGAQFLFEVCDGKFIDDDLNETGNGFAQDYYDEDSSFADEYGSYTDDYGSTFDQKAESNGFEYESFYHIEDTFDNYDLLKPIIDQRFNEWKKYKQNS